MTQNRQRGGKPTPPPAPPKIATTGLDDLQPIVDDPLADLRDDPSTEAPGLPNVGGVDQESTEEPEGPEAPLLLPLATQERQDQARAEAVAAMHADTTTVGFLHKGGGCGCSYIAGVILQTVMPVGPELDADLEPDSANLTDPEGA